MSGKKLLEGVRVANVGVELFAESLAAQNAPVVQVDWRPPAGGDTDMIETLSTDWRLAMRPTTSPSSVFRPQGPYGWT